MKRLFCIKHVSDPKAVKSIGLDTYWESKAEAKAARDEANKIKPGFHVSRGPDHIGKHGHTSVPRMRRQPVHTHFEGVK
jgi:hypothetical protein